MPKLTSTQLIYARRRIKEKAAAAAASVHEKHTAYSASIQWEDIWREVDAGNLKQPTLEQLREAVEMRLRSGLRKLAADLSSEEFVARKWPTKTLTTPEGQAMLYAIWRAEEDAVDNLVLGTDGMEALAKFVLALEAIVGE